MDPIELAEELYEDNRILYGDGEFAWETSKDEAHEIIRRQNVRQDAWEDFERDLWIDRDNVMRFPNQVSDSNSSHSPPHHPTRDATRAPIDGVSIGTVVLGAGLGIGIGIGIGLGIYCLYKILNEDVEKADPIAPSVNNRLDRIDENLAAIRKEQAKMQEILTRLSLPKVA